MRRRQYYFPYARICVSSGKRKSKTAVS